MYKNYYRLSSYDNFSPQYCDINKQQQKAAFTKSKSDLTTFFPSILTNENSSTKTLVEFASTSSVTENLLNYNQQQQYQDKKKNQTLQSVNLKKTDNLENFKQQNMLTTINLNTLNSQNSIQQNNKNNNNFEPRSDSSCSSHTASTTLSNQSTVADSIICATLTMANNDLSSKNKLIIPDYCKNFSNFNQKVNITENKMSSPNIHINNQKTKINSNYKKFENSLQSSTSSSSSLSLISSSSSTHSSLLSLTSQIKNNKLKKLSIQKTMKCQQNCKQFNAINLKNSTSINKNNVENYNLNNSLSQANLFLTHKKKKKSNNHTGINKIYSLLLVGNNNKTTNNKKYKNKIYKQLPLKLNTKKCNLKQFDQKCYNNNKKLNLFIRFILMILILLLLTTFLLIIIFFLIFKNDKIFEIFNNYNKSVKFNLTKENNLLTNKNYNFIKQILSKDIYFTTQSLSIAKKNSLSLLNKEQSNNTKFHQFSLYEKVIHENNSIVKF